MDIDDLLSAKDEQEPAFQDDMFEVKSRFSRDDGGTYSGKVSRSKSRSRSKSKTTKKKRGGIKISSPLSQRSLKRDYKKNDPSSILKNSSMREKARFEPNQISLTQNPGIKSRNLSVKSQKLGIEQDRRSSNLVVDRKHLGLDELLPHNKELNISYERQRNNTPRDGISISELLPNIPGLHDRQRISFDELSDYLSNPESKIQWEDLQFNKDHLNFLIENNLVGKRNLNALSSK